MTGRQGPRLKKNLGNSFSIYKLMRSCASLKKIKKILKKIKN